VQKVSRADDNPFMRGLVVDCAVRRLALVNTDVCLSVQVIRRSECDGVRVVGAGGRRLSRRLAARRLEAARTRLIDAVGEPSGQKAASINESAGLIPLAALVTASLQERDTIHHHTG
jgi:hypothetical protein